MPDTEIVPRMLAEGAIIIIVNMILRMVCTLTRRVLGAEVVRLVSKYFFLEHLTLGEQYSKVKRVDTSAV